MTLLFAACTGAFALFASFYLLRILVTPAEQWVEAEFLEEELRAIQTLENHKEKLVQQLRDLELDFTMNKVSQEDYDTLKKRFERQAVTIAKKIDDWMGGKDWGARVDDYLRQQEEPDGSLVANLCTSTTSISETSSSQESSSSTNSEDLADEKEEEVRGEAPGEGEPCNEAKEEERLHARPKASQEFVPADPSLVAFDDATFLPEDTDPQPFTLDSHIEKGEHLIICRCGTEIAPEDNFCRVCGTPVRRTAVMLTETEEEEVHPA